MKPTVLIISCEHSVNHIPEEYKHLFKQDKSILSSDHAYAFGANEIASYLQETLHCDAIYSTVSRILIDCDHSLHHAMCFSKFTKKLPDNEKKLLIDRYYTPFHQHLSDTIAMRIREGQQVLHLSIHTFSPILDGLLQNAGIGILYDSHRHGEQEVARLIHGLLLQEATPYRIRLNHPFSGSNDFILSHFRKQYEQKDYLGLKMEINQALLLDQDNLSSLRSSLLHSFNELLTLL